MIYFLTLSLLFSYSILILDSKILDRIVIRTCFHLLASTKVNDTNKPSAFLDVIKSIDEDRHLAFSNVHRYSFIERC